MNDVAVKTLSARDLVGDLLDQQQSLTAVDRFSQQHESATEPLQAQFYRDLIPLEKPGKGEQYSFQVDLEACSACKACVSACHHLNGLEIYESWRDVGTLLGDDGQKTVTTACHHCAEPACAEGCPVLAYEKDPETGIVRHLDDQCIGCKYCEMKCPYGVPKYSVRLGIVRKCDMCYNRLAADEAPACVQACPNDAIAIKVVETAAVPASGSMVPGAYDSSYTKPTTNFVGWEAGEGLRPAAGEELRPAHSHLPLVFMLVLTQAAVGISAAALLTGDFGMRLTAVALGALGLGASVLHLGQPLKAWRAFLGWRKSWLSREILVFGAWFSALLAFAVSGLPLIGLGALGLGLAGVFCSVMVYVDTRREFWSMPRTGGRFFGTVLLCGASLIGFPWVVLAVLVKLVAELDGMRIDGSRALVVGPLRRFAVVRFGLLLGGVACALVSPPLALALFIVGELFERVLYFSAVVEPRMP
ncbi:MAG: DmsC/YnfH family molybdoenzyme membrane anchor subunit [Verrucomicrobiales bacterium]